MNTDIHKNYRLDTNNTNTDIHKNYPLGANNNNTNINCTNTCAIVHSDTVDSTNTVINANTTPIIIVLDNIRSAYNVGTIFRTAETAGVSK